MAANGSGGGYWNKRQQPPPPQRPPAQRAEGDNDKRKQSAAAAATGSLSDGSTEGDDYLLFSAISQQKLCDLESGKPKTATCCGSGGSKRATNSAADESSASGISKRVNRSPGCASTSKHPVAGDGTAESASEQSYHQLPIGNQNIGTYLATDQYLSYGTSTSTLSSGSISQQQQQQQQESEGISGCCKSSSQIFPSNENNSNESATSPTSCYRKLVGSFACWPANRDDNSKATNQFNNSNHTFNHFDYEQLDEKTKFWRTIKRKYNATKNHINSLIRLQTQMAPKRYYILLFCTSLIIVACLLASLAISRSIGGGDDLLGTGSGSGRQAASRALRLSSDIEYERRTIDLVDLMECGKTFAYVKIRAQVQVPKSSSTYKQQPSFLHQPASESLLQVGESKQVALVTRRRQEAEPIRFILTSAPHLQESQADGATTTTVIMETTTLAPSRLLSEPIQPVVTFKLNPEAKENKDSAPVKNLAAIWALTTQGKKSGDDAAAAAAVALAPSAESSDELEESESNAELMFGSTGNTHSDGYDDPDDPLQLAASDLSIDFATINSTIVDCFIVDTDKRYNQRVALEDRHRLVASTRKVAFKRMMDTITGCRLLTWSSLDRATNQMANPAGPIAATTVASATSTKSSAPRVPSFLVPNEAVAGGPLTPVDVVKPAEKVKADEQQQQRNGANEFLRSIFNSLFEPQHPAQQQQQQQQQQPQPKPKQTNQLPAMQPAASEPQTTTTISALNSEIKPRQSFSNRIARLATGSGQDPTTATSAAAPNQQQQTSYLNMGISMVSGIVPNTLWCGLGDRASNYSELGAEFKVDACCRAHDHCPVRLRPFTTDYGIVNWSVSTRSHCDCDLDFNECLEAVNSTLSNLIRVLYFRFVGLQCIDIENRQQFDQQQPQAATLIG